MPNINTFYIFTHQYTDKIHYICLKIGNMITPLQYTDNLIYSKLSMLYSEQLKQELVQYIDYLLVKQFSYMEKKRKPKFGCAKGSFIMSADFDEPLEDFNDYMP